MSSLLLALEPMLERLAVWQELIARYAHRAH